MTFKCKTLLLLASAFVMTQASFASSVTWNLNNVTFSDGATASGSFTLDADTQKVSNWAINTTAGVLPAFSYTPGDSTGGSYFQQAGYQNELLFFVNGSTRLLGITPLVALSDAGGVVNINLNTPYGGSLSDECYNCSPYRTIVSGVFTASPEPASIGLLGIGLACAGLATRRFRSQVNRAS